MTTLETWLVNLMYIFIIITFICGWLFYLRAHYAKAVIGKVLCEFITKEGNSYSKLLPSEEGIIDVKPKGKRKGRSFVVADIATYLIDYPSAPRFLSMIQTKVKKAVFDEDSWEPLTNRRGKLLLSPMRLYSVRNERFSQLGVEQAREETEARRMALGGRNTLLYILIGAVILAIVIGGYFIVQNFDAIKGGLGIE